MIEKINYYHDFLETGFTQEDMDMAMVDKINEIIDVVNQLDKRLQKMPEFYRVRAVGKYD